MNLVDSLHSGLQALGLDELQPFMPLYLKYLALLSKWNKVYNLTAVREVNRMLPLHVLDSLAVLPFIQGENLLDVGSGAGLPGIPLAIAKPEMNITLLDGNQKKTTFLRQACIELSLSKVSVTCARVESWQASQKFDIIISRAFSELAIFVQQASHLIAPGGVMLAMKGAHPQNEIAKLPVNIAVERIINLRIPNLEAQRHLVVMRVG